jgi:phospholipid/cholesterol/gamma-HCH transport system ATP-binding protein
MIKFENVSCFFEEKTVLKDISFEVQEGEILVVLGASGSGKTTILRLILGLIRPDSGKIFIDGEDISHMTEHQLMGVRQKIGMVFQEGALFDSLTVGENVAFPMREKGTMSEEEIDARVRKILGFVDMAETIDMDPDELSGGMKRRVAIARALAAYDPKIMLYDEPTTGLDPITAHTICELIVKLRDFQKVCSIMVTHQLKDAFKVATRFIVLGENVIIFEGTGDDLKTSKDAYIQRFFQRSIR